MEELAIIESTSKYKVIVNTFKAIYDDEDENNITTKEYWYEIKVTGNDLQNLIFNTIKEHMQNKFDSMTFTRNKMIINSLYTSELNITDVIDFTEIESECIEELD